MADGPPDRPDPSAGVFETLLVSDGRIQAVDAHIARLAGSLRDLYGQEPPAGLRAQLVDRAAGLRGDHRLRVDAVSGRGALRWRWQASLLDPGRPRVVRCAPVAVPGGLGPHKWADRRLVDRLGAAGPVPLLVDRDGRLLEAAWGNVWVLERGRLVTPPADGRILPGVTRARLLELAPALGLDAAEEPIALAAAVDAPAILLTSSLQLVVQAALGRAATPGAPSATIEAIWTALRSSAWSPGRTSAACGHRPVVTRALRL